MTEKEKYIKACFKEYNENKTRLHRLSFDGLRGVDYTRQHVKGNTKNGNETALVNYLDKKRNIEKRVALVDRVIWYYDLDGNGKDKYIKLRYIKGRKQYQAAMDLFLSDSTLKAWEREIRETAARCADMFNLWDIEQ